MCYTTWVVVPHAWVFAFGSNMNLADLRRWLRERALPDEGLLRAEPATLAGFRLIWNYRSQLRDGGAANLEEAPGVDLPGVAIAVHEAMLGYIDTKEGHPNRYRRVRPHPVELDGGRSVDAWVYRVTEAFLQPPPVWPRRAYLDLMLAGAREHGLPAHYIAELEKTPTCDQPETRSRLPVSS